MQTFEVANHEQAVVLARYRDAVGDLHEAYSDVRAHLERFGGASATRLAGTTAVEGELQSVKGTQVLDTVDVAVLETLVDCLRDILLEVGVGKTVLAAIAEAEDDTFEIEYPA